MKMFSSFLLFARKKYEVVEFLSKNQEENGWKKKFVGSI
jgi:hypothetical protein